MEKSKNRSKAVKIIKIVLISVIALWAVALVVIQVALTPSVLRSAVNGLAAEYVDGHYGRDSGGSEGAGKGLHG